MSVVGVVSFSVSRAATPYVAIEPENGTQEKTTIITDAVASANKSVQFSGISEGGGTQTNNCVPVPSACGFPDATNTGVPQGVVLSNSGSITVTTAGAIIQNLNIAGSINVRANNVVIRNVRITTGDYYPIRVFEGFSGLIVEDSEVIGTSSNVAAAISFDNYTARRLDISGSADGLKVGTNTVVEDSFIHDLAKSVGSHNDGMQYTGGTNVLVRHNTVFNPNDQTAALMFGNDFNSPPTDVRIENNLLNGGNYTIYMDPQGTNRSVTNNRFGRNYVYGLCSCTTGSFTQSGNVWDDTGAALSL